MPNTPDPRAPLLHLIATLSFRLGEFTLSSGAHSDYYIDCRTTTLHAEGGRLAGLALYDLIRHHNLHPQAVGGLTMGADPLVSNIASASAWDHLQNSDAPFIHGFLVRKS
ncbi:MAG TPA: orotate phosphoribosyltransferase, partial [Acidobacteriaceae bacterium]